MSGSNTEWGWKLREERLKRGFSQKYVAQMLETDERTVRSWEKQKHFPSLHYRRGLSLIYGKTIEALGLLERYPRQRG